MINATQLRPGMVIIHNGDLFTIMNVLHLTPGNKRGLIQAKMRNLRSQNQIEYRFSSDERIEKAELEQHEMEYLYNDSEHYHFMNTETYEQITLSAEMLGDAVKYLLPNTKVQLDVHEGKAVGVELPKNVPLKVVEVEPTLKRATASASFKNATLETGIIVRVPSFVQAGDVVKVDTETGEYVERA